MATSYDKGEEDIKTLIKAVETKPKFSRLCVYTLNCFFGLSKNRKNLDRLVQEDGIKTILKVINNNESNPEVIAEGVKPLISACRIPEYKKRIANEGGLEMCMKFLRKSSNLDIKASISKLLAVILDGMPDLQAKMIEMGGLDLMQKNLADAVKTKKPKLAESSLDVLVSLCDQDAAKKIKHETIEQVIKCLAEFKNNESIVEKALKIINKICEGADKETLELMQSMDCVKFISEAIDENPSNREVKNQGAKALGFLSSKNDFIVAVDKMKDKSLNTIEKREAVGLVGNLSYLRAGSTFKDDENVVTTINKIIKPLVRKKSLKKDEKQLLSTCIKAVGKAASLSDKTVNIYNKNTIQMLLSILESKALTPEILISINSSIQSYIQNKKAFDNVVEHKKLLKNLFEKNKRFGNHEGVRLSSNELNRDLCKESSGAIIIEKIGVVPFICDYIDKNNHNEVQVLSGLNVFLELGKNADKVKDQNVKMIIDTALSLLKKTPENDKTCKKALEVLQLFNRKSTVGSGYIKSFECLSALSKFKAVTQNSELKLMVDELKSSGKAKKVMNIEDYLKILEDETKKLGEGKYEKELMKIFEASTDIFEIIEVEEKISEKNITRTLEILNSCLEKLNKLENSDLKNDSTQLQIKIMNLLMQNCDICEEMDDKNYYRTIGAIYAASDAKTQTKEVIAVSADILHKTRTKYIEELNTLDELSENYSSEMLAGIAKIIKITKIINRLPEELNQKEKTQKAIDFTSSSIMKNFKDAKILEALVKLLNVLTKKDKDNKDYFAKIYIESMCKIIKTNPDEEFMINTIIGMLNNYENDKNYALMISDVKNWHINKALESDLETLKVHLLNSALDKMEIESEEQKLNIALQNLAYCYDPKNEMVDCTCEGTKTDEEIFKLCFYLLNSKKITIETKKKSLDILEKMSMNESLLAMISRVDFLGNSDNVNAEEKLVYMQTASNFMKSNSEMSKNIAINQFNKFICNTLLLDEDERMEMLDDLIDNFEVIEGDSSASAGCLENLLKLYEQQKTSEGKAKTLVLITRMVKSSNFIKEEIANKKGLKMVMLSTDDHIENTRFAESLSRYTVNLAENTKCIEKMQEYDVDKYMKKVMFSYSNNTTVFHNAQRTIDLMTLKDKKMTPEELKKWRARMRIKQLMTELCRSLSIKICSVLTRGEREVRTGDTAKDISTESMRILNEFGTSFDEAIETKSDTVLLRWLAEAWLLRSYLMTYTFLVEKDVSARGVIDAPKCIDDTLVKKCGFSAMWDFQNPNQYSKMNRCVRGGIGHQSVRMVIDSSVEAQPCQEVDVVTKEYYGREYTLEDLIFWVKMDEQEFDTLRCFNLILTWVSVNWNYVVLTVSMFSKQLQNADLNLIVMEKDMKFLSLRSGLDWEWKKEVEETTKYIRNIEIEPYEFVTTISKDEKKGGLHIKVNISGEGLRQKRREMKDQLDFSNSNVLSIKEKEDLDFYVEVSEKGSNCRRFKSKLLFTQATSTFLKFDQLEDGDLYISWGEKDAPFEARNRFNMKEIENVLEGKETKSMKKVKEANFDKCFSIIAVDNKELNIEFNSKGDRDIWVKGLRLVLATVASCKPCDMMWT